jgi:glycosyltransferase involved in cell wall biosynthesis
MKLSILIATIPERVTSFRNLWNNLFDQRMNLFGAEQLDSIVEVINDSTDKAQISIGAKRQRLLEAAQGEYVVFIDDDDLVMPNYIEKILEAINEGPDCVDLNILMLTNQVKPQMCYHHRLNRVWHEDRGAYYRTVTHFNPIKREIALQVGFQDIRFGEDKDYSDKVTKLCSNSIVIPEIIYIYNYSNKIPHNEKYGIL